MAVCNIFNDLSKPTGTFLTFSQYAEDLTQWNTQSIYHRVIPSKFIALEISKENNFNNSLPKLIQDKYENGCAVWRNKGDYNVNYSKSLFWNCLMDLGILVSEEESGVKKLQNVKYAGDINIQSYNNHGDMGYSEIYCHIPNDASQYQYSYIYDDTSVKVESRSSNSIIEGFSDGELNGYEKLWSDCEYKVGDQYNFPWDGFSELSPIKLETDSFDVNAIIVLYDVYNGDDKKYENVPLGIYFTGIFNDGELTNKITKYVSNEDIFGSGTSYGLRICSRFAMTPHSDNYVVKDITVEGDNYSELTKVLSEIAISQNKMDDIVNKTYNLSQNYKDLLAIFKNSRTNVPYIKIINGESYWFVNGRMVSTSAEDGCDCDSYTDQELDQLMGIDQSFKVIATAYDINDNSIFDITKGTPREVKISWSSLYHGKEVIADKIIINGEILTGVKSVVKSVEESTSFVIESYYKDMKAVTTVDVEFVYPTYFGLIDEELCYNIEHYNDYTENHEFTPNVEDIKNLDSYLYNSKIQEYNITSNNVEHVCLAYPASFGELESITDENGYVYYINKIGSSMDSINDFYKSKVQLHDIEYYVYTDRVPVNVNNQILKFR